jgi:hypothetical protein
MELMGCVAAEHAGYALPVTLLQLFYGNIWLGDLPPGVSKMFGQQHRSCKIGQMFSRITTLIQKLLTSADGGVAVQIGVGLAALIGTLGLGTESTFLLFKHRQMQSVADSAALSGAMALSQEYPRDPRSEARAVAGRLGYVHGVNASL